MLLLTLGLGHVVAAAAVDSTQQAPNPILPAADEMIWGILAFAILLFGMWKWAFPMVQKTLEERSNRIRKDLDDAERVKGEAETVLADYKAQLGDARSEANRIIEEARQTADQLRRDLMARAESEVAELRQRSQDDIRAAQDRALADLQSSVKDLVIELAEKVVVRNLDRDTNLALIESFIAEVGSQGR
jgi:F-type H+-transporting ATPase subunit b